VSIAAYPPAGHTQMIGVGARAAPPGVVIVKVSCI
jgi:hypothetical protein